MIAAVVLSIEEELPGTGGGEESDLGSIGRRHIEQRLRYVIGCIGGRSGVARIDEHIITASSVIGCSGL